MTLLLIPIRLNYSMILTTMWDRMADRTLGEQSERDLIAKYWKPSIDQGAHTTRIDSLSNTAKYKGIVRKLMKNIGKTLDIQRELVDEKKNLEDTGAGKVVNSELARQTAAIKRELEDLRKEAAESEKRNDANSKLMRDTYQQAQQELQTRLQRLSDDRVLLQQSITEMQRQAAAERQAFQRNLEQMQANSTAEKNRLLGEIAKIRDQVVAPPSRPAPAPPPQQPQVIYVPAPNPGPVCEHGYSDDESDSDSDSDSDY